MHGDVDPKNRRPCPDGPPHDKHSNSFRWQQDSARQHSLTDTKSMAVSVCSSLRRQGPPPVYKLKGFFRIFVLLRARGPLFKLLATCRSRPLCLSVRLSVCLSVCLLGQSTIHPGSVRAKPHQASPAQAAIRSSRHTQNRLAVSARFQQFPLGFLF